VGSHSRTHAFLLTVLLIASLIVFSIPPGLTGETTLEADRITVTGGKTVARGNVRLTRSDLELNTDHLELTRDEEVEEIIATGKVTVSTDETTIRAEGLSGTLAGEGESSQLSLWNVTGELASIRFRGNEVEIALNEGKPDRVNLSTDAKITFADNSYLEGEIISLDESEAGWSFEVTGNSLYETDSTTLRAEVIRGTSAGGSEEKTSKLNKTVEKTVAEGDVRLIDPDWSLSSGYLELKATEKTKNVKASGNVKLTAGDFSILGENLSGELAEKDSTDTLRLNLKMVDGKSDSIGFSGGEVDLVIVGGSLENMKITRDSTFSLNQGPSIRGNEALLKRSEKGWNFSVEGEVVFENRTTGFTTERISGEITTGEGGARITALNSETLSGEIELEGSSGKITDLRVRGESATLEFDEDSKLSSVDFEHGSFTSCKDCNCSGGCAYSISANRTSLIDRDFVLARSARLKSFGFPVGWSPLYFISLKEVGLPRRPYFPRIGYSATTGVSASGAFPVFLDVDHFGNVIFDYFSRSQGFGLGLDYYSGGTTVSGVGQIYGIYRLSGDSSFKIDGAIDLTPANWMKLSAEATVKQGLLEGTDYDQNEWGISLTGRESAPDWKIFLDREEKESDDELDHVIERVPEISLSLKPSVGGFPGSYELFASAGYYREIMEDWSRIRSGPRGKIGGELSVSSSSLNSLDLYINGEVWANPYLTGSEGEYSTRVWWNAEPGLKIGGAGTLEVSFTHRNRLGESPFEFDEVEKLDRLNLSYKSSQPGIAQELKLHYDFEPQEGFSDIEYVIDFQSDLLDQQFGLKYDVEAASISSISSETALSGTNLQLNLATGYDFAAESVSETNLGFQFSEGENSLVIELTGDPFDNWLREVSGELNLNLLEDWSIGLKGEYNVTTGDISNLSYSVYNTLQDCLKVGITGDISGVWFDVEIAGF